MDIQKRTTLKIMYGAWATKPGLHDHFEQV